MPTSNKDGQCVGSATVNSNEEPQAGRTLLIKIPGSHADFSTHFSPRYHFHVIKTARIQRHLVRSSPAGVAPPLLTHARCTSRPASPPGQATLPAPSLPRRAFASREWHKQMPGAPRSNGSAAWEARPGAGVARPADARGGGARPVRACVGWS